MIKHFPIRISFICVILLCCRGLKAEEAFSLVSEGLCFSINPSTRTAHVIHDNSIEYSGEIIIPSMVSSQGVDYIVTSIEESAFMGSSISSVTIGSNISSIGPMAFSLCPLLNTIIVDPANHIYFSYENSVYQNTALGIGNLADNSPVLAPSRSSSRDQFSDIVLVAGCNGTRQILSEATEIGEFAFSGTSVQTLFVPASIRKVHISAFSNCKELKRLCFWGSCPTIDADIPFSEIAQMPDATLYALNTSITGFQESVFNQYYQSIRPFGDANRDSKLNTEDIDTILSYLLNQSIESIDIFDADMNLDGVITISDLTMLIKSL